MLAVILKEKNQKKIKKVKNYLWTFRKRAGYSQKQAARILGHKDTSQISRYERGARIPSLETVIKMEIAYDTPVDRLFGGLLEELRRDVEKRKKELHEILRGEDGDENEEEVLQTTLN